jgi:1,4-dihydroxy-2-naphthoyl-CoA synthase
MEYDWYPAEDPRDWRTIKYDPKWHDYTACISINNPNQMNSYVLGTLKEICSGFERAMGDDSVQFIVLTGVGDKAFCTGGSVHEYAEKYNRKPSTEVAGNSSPAVILLLQWTTQDSSLPVPELA